MSETERGWTADGFAKVIDVQTIEDGSGGITRNRRGDILGLGIKGISNAEHKRLRELGWEQIAINADGTHHLK